MVTIPTRHILATGASVAARPCLRAIVRPVPAEVASSRVAFSSNTSSASAGTNYPAAPIASRPQQPRQPPRRRRETYAPLRHGVRWSTGSAEGKIWTFEEIQSLTTKSPSPSSVLIIDVREPHELQETGRIPGAVNIPIKTAPDGFHLTPDEFELRFGFPRPDPDADTTIVCYCRAGVRSRAAAALARNAGWKNVGEYPGSWNEWVEKGGAVEK